MRFQNHNSADDENSVASRGSRDRARRDLSKQMQDSSSDSDFEDFDSNYGPTTRRAWSDWCSNKGKSSQSEEEGNGKVWVVIKQIPSWAFRSGWIDVGWCHCVKVAAFQISE